MDVRSFTVGMVQENCYIARASREATRAVIIDPGDEAERLLGAIETLGVEIEAILVTHCHFDHIGAVAPVARATGAPVYCPAAEVFMLEDINSYTFPGMGPFENYTPEERLEGGEHLTLAGLDIDVLLTPGHSPGHVTYSIPDEQAAFSGDVLFQGSVGRTDLPGADWGTLLRSIGSLLDALPDQTTIYPGHMAITTLGTERGTTPFLTELRAAR